MTATMLAPRIIDAPGVYDLTDAEYHQDPVPGGSLSASGAKLLLPPSCPAKFRYAADHPTHKREFDFGQLAHRKMLGIGVDIELIDAPDYKTKRAQEAKAAAYAAGKTPVLPKEVAVVDAMAAALAAHPWASVLFEPGTGQPEQSLFWIDLRWGVWRRARLDWLPATPDEGRLVVPDYKTCNSADLNAISRTAANFRYHLSADWYLTAVEALGLAPGGAVFVFVFQEKTPPYLVTVVELDAPAMRAGHVRSQRALEIFRDCQASGEWPGYATDIERIALPAWAERDYEETW